MGLYNNVHNPCEVLAPLSGSVGVFTVNETKEKHVIVEMRCQVI